MADFLDILDETGREEKAAEYVIYLLLVSLVHDVDPLTLTVEEFSRLLVQSPDPPGWANTYWGSAAYE